MNPDEITTALNQGESKLAARLEAAESFAQEALGLLAEARHALKVVMPMVKGYAAEHQVGRNRQIAQWAEHIADKGTDAAMAKEEGK